MCHIYDIIGIIVCSSKNKCGKSELKKWKGDFGFIKKDNSRNWMWLRYTVKSARDNGTFANLLLG